MAKVGIECGEGWISRDKICRGGKSDEVSQQLDKLLALAPKKSLKQLADEAAVKISAETKKTARSKVSTKEEKKKLLQEEKEAWVFLRTFRKKEALLKKNGSDSSEEIDRLTSLLQKLADGDSEALEKAYVELLSNIEEAKKSKVSKASEAKIEKIVSLVATAIESPTKDEKNLSAITVAAPASTEGLKYSKYIPTKLEKPSVDKIRLEKEISAMLRVPTSPNKQLNAEGLDATILVEKSMPNYAFTPILDTPEDYSKELKVWEDNKDLILKNLGRNQYDAKLRILQSVPNMSDFSNRKEFIDSAEQLTKVSILVNASAASGDWDFEAFAYEFSKESLAKNNHIAIYYGEPASVDMPVGDESIRGKFSIPPLPSKINRGDGVNDNNNKDIRNFLEEADVYMQVSLEAIESIIKDDKFKNMFNRGAVNSIGAGGSGYRKDRINGDTTLFGLDPKAKPDERPIFGYIQNKNRALSEGFEKVKDYGQIQIKFKPSIKERTSFTIGDSLEIALYDKEKASPMLNPKIVSKRAPKLKGNSANEIEVLTEYLGYRNLLDYVEAQIFGPTKLEDIDTIRIPASLAESNPQLIEKLESLGIYVTMFVPY